MGRINVCQLAGGRARIMRVVLLSAAALLVGSSHAAPEEEPGLTLLDRAIELKWAAQRLNDLDEVISLSEQALEAGLTADNQAFARQLLTSTLYERASRLAQSLEDGELTMAWAQRRAAAISSLQKALEFDADNSECHLLLAQMHLMPGGDKEAGLAAAERAVALFADNLPRRAEALVARGGFHDSLEQRLEDYSRAIQDDPSNLKARRERGGVYLAMEKPEQALADFVFVMEQEQTDLTALRAAAQILASQEKFDEALQWIDRGLQAAGDQAILYVLRSGIRTLQDDLTAAMDDLDQALKLDPGNLAGLLARAQLASELKEYDEALADASRVLELRPGLPQGLLLRASIAMDAKKYGQAVADLRQLLRLEPKNTALQLQIAAVYLADERPSRAIAMYDEVLQDSPSQWQARRGKGDALLSLGQHKEAIAEYEQALAIEPEESSVLNNLAWVLATSPDDGLRDAQRAIELAKRACEVTEYQAAHILSTLAAGYAENGDFTQAIEWSTKAVELGEGDVKEQLEAELKSYQNRQPWRERQQVQERDEEKASLADDLGLEARG